MKFQKRNQVGSGKFKLKVFHPSQQLTRTAKTRTNLVVSVINIIHLFSKAGACFDSTRSYSVCVL